MKLIALHQLLLGITYEKILGNQGLGVKSLRLDSRQVEPGDLFIAMPGYKSDGHLFIPKAVENGASYILCHQLPELIDDKICYVVVEDVRKASGRLVANFFGDPSKKLKLIGVTGTNGKTTIATLLYEFFQKSGFKAGLLSTVENKIASKVIPSTHTTPDIISINQLMAEMVEAGCTYAVMEVSSHAIDQMRIDGLDFDGGLFTNLTVDHLDYHHTFKEYVYTKKKFFDQLKPEAFALCNIDDKNGEVMMQNTRANRKSYAVKRMADFKGSILRNSLEGLQMRVNQKEAFFRLIGMFNAYNLLAVYGAAELLGFNQEEILLHLSSLEPARGRFEIIRNPLNQQTAIIDYAHSPDSLENVLKTIVEVKGKESRIITICGAGGDRDKTKRPQMGAIAGKLSDLVIFTTDNPRSEEPECIIDEMVAGVDKEFMDKIMKVTDRSEAIKIAAKLADPADIILIAGKGHETYQEIKGVRYPFDDKEKIHAIWH